MKRITTRLRKEPATTMANWPDEKCTEIPNQLEGMVSMKRRKRRVINIARKFYAVLEKGLLKLFLKKKVGIAPNPDFQIDLAKATVMYDDRRIILHFKTANETHTLTPLDQSLEVWKVAICKHRLHRQEQIGKGLQLDNNRTLDTISARQRYADDKGWESQAGNKMFDEVHQMQGLTLEVLEKLTKTYEEMQKTNEEMKQALKNMREAMAKSMVTESTSAWTTGTTTATPSILSTVARSTTTNLSTTTDMRSDSKTRGTDASSEDDEEDSRGQPGNIGRKK